MARLRYRTGMCLLERQRLRIKCVDFVGREISGHSDKGGRDRCVPLPESLRGRLLRQRRRSLVLQGQDPAGGNGRVHLPHVSARKYPGADGGPGWPYLSLRARVCLSAHWPGRAPPCSWGNPRRAIQGCARACGHRQARHPLRVAVSVRHALAGGRLRYPHGAGAARPLGSGGHADPHARAGRWHRRSAQSVGPIAGCRKADLSGPGRGVSRPAMPCRARRPCPHWSPAARTPSTRC